MSLNVDVLNIFKNYSIILEQQEEANKQVMTAQDWDKFTDRLAGAKKKLRATYPFYFFVLDRLRTVPDLKIPTMAVDDFHNIYINPFFALNELTLEEVSGVLAHEASHIYRKDFARRGNRDPQLWNVAADYVINKILLRDGHKLPSFGCLPVNKNNSWWIDFTDPLTGTHLKIDITDMMTEDVYDALLQNWKKNKEMQQLIQKLIEKQQEMDQHIDTESGDSQPEGVSEVEGEGGKSEVSGRFKKTDAETTQKSKGEKEAQATNITNQAAQEAKKEASRGTGSGMPSELEIEIKAPSVNWKSVLRQFLSLGSKAYYNIKKPNKRALAAGYYAPKMERVYNKLDAVITLDTSGSITEGMVRTFVSEVVAIIKAAPNVRVLVIFWESHAYSPLPGGEPFIIEASRMSIDQAEKNLKSLKISRGGTLLSSITPYYQKVKSTIPGFKPAVLITFTDGYIEEDPILPADIPFDKRVFLINNLSMSGQKTMAGDDSIVKKVGKHVMGVKVEG